MLAVAGLASLFQMGDPLCTRLTGIAINQPDLPHWATAVLGWLGMVHNMQQATGEIGDSYGSLLKMALEEGPASQFVNVRTGKTSWLSGPASVYGIYQQFCLALETEAKK